MTATTFGGRARRRWRLLGILVAAAAVLAVLGPISSARAATTYVVDDDGAGAPGNCDDATPASTSVQLAVTTAASGDTIQICPGTYTEQVTIRKNLTVVGAGTGATMIKAPAALLDSLCLNPASGRRTVVDICNGAEVDLSQLIVAGPGPAGCGTLHYGVLVTGNADAHVHHAVVQDIRDQPAGGCQNGVGIQVGVSPTLALNPVGRGNLHDLEVKRYQKNGITIDGAGTEATVASSSVAGAGPVTTIAQNGIQVSRGAKGTITGNVVTGNQCDVVAACGADHLSFSQATGILLFEASPATTISRNHFTGNDIGIYSYLLSAAPVLQVTGNVVAGNRYIGVHLDQGSVALTGNDIAGPGGIGVLAISYDGNTVNSQATITGNQIHGLGTGIQVQDVNAGAGVPIVTATKNLITEDGRGVVNLGAPVVQATQNWWGAPTGPSDWSNGTGTAVSEEVDFFPWHTSTALTTLAACSKTGSNISGTSGNDILCGTAGNDTLRGLGGNDLLLGQGGADNLFGDGGLDAVIGHAAADNLRGGPDVDSLQGRDGTDSCNGDEGADRFSSCP